MTILKKNKKAENRLPMPEKVKRGFRCYCSLVMALALMGCCLPYPGQVISADG